jgi:hypothetical protein
LFANCVWVIPVRARWNVMRSPNVGTRAMLHIL